MPLLDNKEGLGLFYYFFFMSYNKAAAQGEEIASLARFQVKAQLPKVARYKASHLLG